MWRAHRPPRRAPCNWNAGESRHSGAFRVPGHRLPRRFTASAVASGPGTANVLTGNTGFTASPQRTHWRSGAPQSRALMSVAPSNNALPVTTRLEEYVIQRVLGIGGFGITYLAREPRPRF